MSTVSLRYAFCAGSIGGFAVAAIGARFTRSLRALACGGAIGGLAIGVITGVVQCWVTNGFDRSRLWVIPLAVLALLLIMAAQNWFVFYEDRRDAALSARPALVLICSGILSMLAVHAMKSASLLQLIWAGAGSLAILLCIHPVQRAIELNRNATVGAVVGFCKVMLPLAFIVLFLPAGIARRPGESEKSTFTGNLFGLFADIGILPLVTLINGARVAKPPRAADPLEHLLQPRDGQSVTGKSPALSTDSVVLVLVAALHVLGIIVLIKG